MWGKPREELPSSLALAIRNQIVAFDCLLHEVGEEPWCSMRLQRPGWNMRPSMV